MKHLFNLKNLLYILALCSLALIKINEKYFSHLFNEINVTSIVSKVSSNLYSDYSMVSSEKIQVIDLNIVDDNLVIYPMSNEIVLPINGVIKKVTKNEIIISTPDVEIILQGKFKNNYNIYQYYNSYSVLAYSDFYIITSGKDKLENSYIINYEKI